MQLDRRTVLISGTAALAVPAGAQARAAQTAGQSLMTASEMAVPAIGLGTWLTFNIDREGPEVQSRLDVLKTFFEAGGGMIDSSPMYAPAEQVLGDLLPHLDYPASLFSATKIWTPIAQMGPAQMKASHGLWGLPEGCPLDLVFVHNLLNWEAHLPFLIEAKTDGRVRHIGLTTSHGRRHTEMEQLIETENIDAVQFTYNITHRSAEARLLPAAMAAGLKVIINRPFDGGQLFERFEHHPLPDFAADIACENWAQFFLKFIISHPAVTTAIPATSNPSHMAENLGALSGPLPDAALRKKMIAHVENL